MTDFKTHPVRFLSRASNGVMAFGYDGGIYTMASDSAAPERIPVEIHADTEVPVVNRGGRPGFSRRENGCVYQPWGCVCHVG